MRGGIPLRRLLPFLLLLLMLPAARADALPDGHFHGYYADGGSVQIELDFTVENGRFASAAYETLAYRDGDYLSATATQTQRAIAAQFEQLASSLTGGGEERIEALYRPEALAEPVDAVTGATIKSGKLVHAIWDGFLRAGEELPVLTGFEAAAPLDGAYPDGTYRGFSYAQGQEQLAIQFSLTDGVITALSFRRLNWNGHNCLSDDASAQNPAITAFLGAANDLVGKPVSRAAALCDFSVDTASGATVSARPLAQAIGDALAHRPFRDAQDTVLPEDALPADKAGTAEVWLNGETCCTVRYVLKEGRFASLRAEGIAGEDVAERMDALLDTLLDEPPEALVRLYALYPGDSLMLALNQALWTALSE